MLLRSKSRLIVIFVLLFFAAQSPADEIPDINDIDRLAAKAGQAAEYFFAQTFEIRMRYEYAGGFWDANDVIKLREIAAEATARLEQIANEQNRIKKQIEDYQGNDWETRFGRTGLWRRLAADLQKTNSEKLEIDSCLAIADGVKSDCPPSAVKSGCAVLRAAMEKIRRFGPAGPDDLNDIARTLVDSDCSNNREMLFSLAILQRKFAPCEFQKTLSRYPQVASLLGRVILADLSMRGFEYFSPVDAELAAIAALNTNPAIHEDIIIKLAESEKFQTPAVLYAASSLLSQTNPRRAVDMLIQAAGLQSRQGNGLLGVTAEEMAGRAFEIAFEEFQKEPNACLPAITAFENYSRISSKKIDEQTQYLYAGLLNRCGRTDEAAKMFRELAGQSQSLWNCASELELLKINLNKGIEPDKTVSDLSDFILRCNRPEELAAQIRSDALNIYCRMLLEQENAGAADKVIQILDAALPTPGLPYELYRAQAFQRLGQLEDAILAMRKATDVNDCSTAHHAVSLVSETLEKIELWQQNARDFNQMLLDCNILAEFAYYCLNHDIQAAIVFTETSLLLGGEPDKNVSFEEDGGEHEAIWRRLIARRLMHKGDFRQAARVWARTAEFRRFETAEQNKRSYGWWQAKYYELECLAKTPNPDKSAIIHTIEVLQHTYTEIPAPWAEKFELLKSLLQDNTN